MTHIEQVCPEPNHSAGLHDVSCPDYKKPEYDIEAINEAAKKTVYYKQVHAPDLVGQAKERFKQSKGTWEVYGELGMGISYGKLWDFVESELRSLKRATEERMLREVHKILFNNDSKGVSLIESYASSLGIKDLSEEKDKRV